jgi:hypothetical protein
MTSEVGLIATNPEKPPDPTRFLTIKRNVDQLWSMSLPPGTVTAAERTA